jgi:aryl-alcohol dehydrogenase-like predicted oxidoreductase
MTDLPHRQLGPAGLPVTRIGLGLAAIGRPGYLNLGHGRDLGPDRSVEALERHAHAMLDAAHAAGVRYFDAARSYGRAEAFLGSWLRARGLGREDVTVGSKWGYIYTADWRVDADPPEVKELTLANFRRQLAETREVLGEELRLYQIHSATLESGVLEDAGLRAELDKLRADGVSVGLSVTGPKQGATVERARELGGFDTVQATWNPLEPSAGPALARAHKAGMGVIVKEALANGRLTERGEVEPLAREARRLGTTADALALAAVLAQPWADVVLSGTATVAHLESNLAAIDVELDEEAEGALAELAEPAPAYWERRAELTWN